MHVRLWISDCLKWRFNVVTCDPNANEVACNTMNKGTPVRKPGGDALIHSHAPPYHTTSQQTMAGSTGDFGPASAGPYNR